MCSKSTSSCANASARLRKEDVRTRLCGGSVVMRQGTSGATALKAGSGVVAIVAVFVASVSMAEPPDSSLLARRSRRHHRSVTTVTTTAPVPAGRSIDELQGEVSNVRQQSAQTAGEVKQIQQAIVVKPQASADTPPKTIGEHVA